MKENLPLLDNIKLQFDATMQDCLHDEIDDPVLSVISENEVFTLESKRNSINFFGPPSTV